MPGAHPKGWSSGVLVLVFHHTIQLYLVLFFRLTLYVYTFYGQYILVAGARRPRFCCSKRYPQRLIVFVSSAVS